jgi:hypothetical protein
VARVNGQEHAHEAEKWLTTSHHHTDSSPADDTIALHTALQAQAHATLAVAYAQAGAWADVPSPETLVVHPLRPDDPRNKVTTHVRESTDEGPDYCGPCSSAIGDWVPWPCAGSVSSGPCLTYGCVRAQGHDGNHVAANGNDWPDA